jgi:superfamily II DNA or RNA helicase
MSSGKGFLIDRVTMPLDFGKDKERIQTMLKPSGNMCKSADKAIAAHQIVAAKIADELVSGDNRGVLLWHSTGSGKTCTAAAMMESVWSTKLRIIYVTNVEASVANDVAKIAECAYNMKLEYWKGRTLEQVNRSFVKRRVELWTFAKLAHHLQLYRARQAHDGDQQSAWKGYLKNTFVVIDEAHSLLEASSGQTKEYDALYDFLNDTSSPLQTGMKIVLMTATPGDTVEDVVKLMNILRKSGAPKLKWNSDSNVQIDFCKAVRGMVSYFDYSSDKSRFPKVDEVIHTATMSKEQAREISAKGGPEPGSAALAVLVEESRTNQYWKVARAYSNSLFNFPSDISLNDFSPKLAMLIETIQKYPDDKHFVYSAFHERRGYGGHGARGILKALTTLGGYVDYGAGGPSSGKRSAAIISGSNEVTSVVKAYNDVSNDAGKKIHVLIATQRYNEGIDLKSVKHVHVFDPLMSYTADIQVKGRAIRMCSHGRLDFEKDWNVTIHRYFSKPPDVSIELGVSSGIVDELKQYLSVMNQELEVLKGKGSSVSTDRKEYLKKLKDDIEAVIDKESETKKDLKDLSEVPAVDSIVYQTVLDQYKDTAALLHAMKELAIDCSIFKEFHEQTGKKIECKY